MNFKQLIIAGLIGAGLGLSTAAVASTAFNRAKAEALCKAAGWPGYPDSYQDACVEGARMYFEATR